MAKKEATKSVAPTSRVRALLADALPPFISYAAGAGALSMLQLRLTGGALWVPQSRRQFVFTLGFLAGGICFGLARNAVDRRFSPLSRSKRAKARVDVHAKRSFAMTRALFWIALTIALFGAFSAVRGRAVQSWSMNADEAYVFIKNARPFDPILAVLKPAGSGVQEAQARTHPDPDSEPAPPELEGWSYAFANVHLEGIEGGVEGSLLLPFWGGLSAETLEFLDIVHYSNGEPVGKPKLSSALDTEPRELIDIMAAADREAIEWTRYTFVVIHILLLCSASAAFGFAYHRLETIYEQTGSILGTLLRGITQRAVDHP